MPLKVSDLKPGDRVILNCPKSRMMAQREAQFEGIFATSGEAMERDMRGIVLVSEPTLEFLNTQAPWARFLFRRTAALDVHAAFPVDPDAGLHDDEGRRIFVERRVAVDPNEYMCEACGGTFIKGWTEAEAQAEVSHNFPGLRPDQRAQVCDDCFRQMMRSANG